MYEHDVIVVGAGGAVRVGGPESGTGSADAALGAYYPATVLSFAEAGEEITIARHGRPVARLAPIPRPRRERKPGALKGQIHYLDGDDPGDTDPEIVDMMENEPIFPVGDTR